MIPAILALLNSTPVTRETLGKLGGNARFVPPRRDVANDAQHGIASDSAHSSSK